MTENDFLAVPPLTIDPLGVSANLPRYAAPTYNASRTYFKGEYCWSSSVFYKSILNGSGHTPASSPTYWQVESVENLVAPWNSGTSYAAGDLVAVSRTRGATGSKLDYSKIYYSVAGSNLNNDPEPDDGSWWIFVCEVYRPWPTGFGAVGGLPDAPSTVAGERIYYGAYIWEATQTNTSVYDPNTGGYRKIGPMAAIAPFVLTTTTPASAPFDLTYSVATDDRLDTLGLLGLQASSVNIAIEIDVENLALYSEQFDNAAYTKSGATVTANAAISPIGGAIADYLVEDTSTGEHYLSQSITTETGDHVLSVYAKYGLSRRIRLRIDDGVTPVGHAEFDLLAETATDIVGTGATIEDIGSGWKRCSVKGALAGTSVVAVVGLADLSGNASYTGTTGYATIWGAQLERRSSLHGYVSTTSAPASVSEEIHNADHDLSVSSTIGYTSYRDTLTVRDLPDEYGPTVTITVTNVGTSLRKLGQAAFGTEYLLGQTEIDGEVGTNQYSYIERSEIDGSIIGDVVDKGYKKKGRFSVFVSEDDFSGVVKLLSDLGATPALYVASTRYDCAAFFGLASWAGRFTVALGVKKVDVSIDGF